MFFGKCPEEEDPLFSEIRRTLTPLQFQHILNSIGSSLGEISPGTALGSALFDIGRICEAWFYISLAKGCFKRSADEFKEEHPNGAAVSSLYYAKLILETDPHVAREMIIEASRYLSHEYVFHEMIESFLEKIDVKPGEIIGRSLSGGAFRSEGVLPVSKGKKVVGKKNPSAENSPVADKKKRRSTKVKEERVTLGSLVMKRQEKRKEDSEW